MIRRALPARYTIERRSAPLSRRRFLSTASDGTPRWNDTVDVFRTARYAETFIDQRLGAGGHDAVVVRHTVH